jgi:hypothetical protein
LLAFSQDQAGGHKGKGRGKTNTASAGATPEAAARTTTLVGTAASREPASASGPSATTPTDSPASEMDAPAPSDPALTDPAQRYHLLVGVYRADLGKSAPLPELAQAIEASGKKKDQQRDFAAANAELEAALLQKMPVPDNELEILGRHRARAIQDVLLIGTDIDPSRVFVIGSAPKAAVEKDKVRVELALK